jgi:hypothetical protein
MNFWHAGLHSDHSFENFDKRKLATNICAENVKFGFPYDFLWKDKKKKKMKAIFNLNKFELSCFKGWQKHVKIFACLLKYRHYVWLLFLGMRWEMDPICCLVFTKFNSCCQASYSKPPNSGREKILYICTHLPYRTWQRTFLCRLYSINCGCTVITWYILILRKSVNVAVVLYLIVLTASFLQTVIFNWWILS